MGLTPKPLPEAPSPTFQPLRSQGQTELLQGEPPCTGAILLLWLLWFLTTTSKDWQYRAGKGFLAHPGWEGDLAVSCCELHVCVHRAADPGWLGVRGWGEREGDVHSHTWLTAITAALVGSPRPQIHAHCQIFSKNTSLEVLFSFLDSEFLRKAIKAPTSTKMYFVLKVESTTPKLGSPKAVLCVSTIKGFIRGGF